MGKRIGFLGCGKIGKAILADTLKEGVNEISYIQDPGVSEKDFDFQVSITSELDLELLKKTDMVIESATASVVKKEAPTILQHCDMLIFSVTAFSDKAFHDEIIEVCKKNGTHIYLPHGAIIGIDGLVDAGDLLHEVIMETVKPPKSLGRTDTERTVLYEGTTRQACVEYPRNVNVHACIAMAGVGFDKMSSKIISDPAVTENIHYITAIGEGFRFELKISSFASGGVTGAYTPKSACGSVRRATDSKDVFRFV